MYPRTLALICFLALLVGCGGLTPTLRLERASGPVRGARLAVVALEDSIQVRNAGRLRQDVPLGADTTYTDLFWDTLLPALQEQLVFDRVERERVVGAAEFAPVVLQVPPRNRWAGRSAADGVTVRLPERGQPVALAAEADYVLFLERVAVNRARLGAGMPMVAPGGMMVGSAGVEGIAFTTRATLWDNRTGQPISARNVTGEAEGERSRRLFRPRRVERATWDAAMEELVGELMDALPLAAREEAGG